MTTRFVVIGAGGLGCPALLGLAAGGAERIAIVDHDVVEASNLQRQVLFGLADIGRAKAPAAAAALRELAPQVDIETIEARVDREQAAEFLARFELGSTVVLECSDDPQLKFAVHDACVELGVPVVIGGVVGLRGQVMAIDPRVGRSQPSACYRCVFEAPPPRELAPACATVGVLGAGAGLIGHWMALLALQLDRGESVGGTLHSVDFLRTQIRSIAPEPRSECPICSARATSIVRPT